MIEPVRSMVASSTVSMPSTVAVPALNALVIRPVGRSIRTTPLFSWSVSASWLRPLTETYSGSGSVGSVIPASARTGRALPSALVSGTVRTGHLAGAAAAPRSMICTKPAGACGRSPFFPPGGVASSSRSFSMATAAYRLSSLTTMESGWPPRPRLATRSRSRSEMTSSRPDGSAGEALVSTTTRTYCPTTDTEVGSSSASPSRASDSVPRPRGAPGSLMSRKPMRRAAASVWTRVRPSSLTADISATVSVAGSSPAGRFWKTG
ncbi:hypothetical protein [Streptomyces broussonetiae]|uniref:Uncharacterized protein n=1 Tax=Streptomyces broussonetiae TaxID=2686304 RepID=A0ABV5EKT1_9ACTN